MFAVAYIVTAVTATVAGASTGLTPGWALFVGLVGGALPSGVAAFLNRKKTNVDVVAELTKATSGLLADYRLRDSEMEARMTVAENTARVAASSDAECKRRLAELESKMSLIAVVTGETKPPTQ